MEITTLIQKLKMLKLPRADYAVFGSAVMAINGIRKAPNIDVIVSNDLWKDLLEKNTPDSEGFIRIGPVKISNWWFAPTRKPLMRLIKEACEVNEVPFVKLEEVLDYKRALQQPKQQRDVELIQKFLAHQEKKSPTKLGFSTYKKFIKTYLREVDATLSKEIVGMIIFGSICRNQAKGESDIDIFTFYDDQKTNKEEVNKILTEIIIKLRKHKEYQSLVDKNIYPEIYPFLISKSKSNEILWVFLDATDHGIIIKSDNQFCENLIKKIKVKIKSTKTRRIILPNDKWCWVFNNYEKQEMKKRERAKLLFAAAKECADHMQQSFTNKQWNMAVRRAQETVELELQGLLALVGIHYPKDHDPAPLLFRVLTAQGLPLPGGAQKIEKISADLSRKRGPALHQTEGYDETTATEAINDVAYLYKNINKLKNELLKQHIQS